MANSVRHVRDIGDLEPQECLVLVTRIGVGAMSLGHALMMAGVLGLDHAADGLGTVGAPGWLAYATNAGELAGGALLLAGLYVRQVAMALLPLLVTGSLLQLATDGGLSVAFATYFLINFAGQGLLAGWSAPAAPAFDE